MSTLNTRPTGSTPCAGNHLVASSNSRKPLRLLTAATLALTQAIAAQAHPEKTAHGDGAIEELTVTGVRSRLRQAGTLKDSIQKTEVIGEANIEAKHAANLSQAIATSPGARVANECSMCGVKRIMLNGMRGEHTTILVDGLPVHTMISGYYAVDAIAMTGVQRIEVARGAGASLTTPEAMGGTINVITKEAIDNSAKIDLSMGQHGLQQLGVVGTLISEDARTRATLIGQYDSRDQFDADRNGVSENPLQDNRNLSLRISHDLTDRDNLTLRYGKVFSEVFGGPVIGDQVGSIGETLASLANGSAPQLFVDNDVRQGYLGEPWETAEWVETRRQELSASWLREINLDWNMQLSVSYSENTQDSFYEGFDYYAEDRMRYFDGRFNYSLNDAHLLTFGADSKTNTLDSSSRAGEASAAYVADSFDYHTQGLYLQDRWLLSDSVELAFALRIDRIEADFTAPQKPGVEIDETIISPRFDGRIFHDDRWTSRLSAGRGYRAPLSFFETDHGILDGEAGFAIEVDSLERSLTGSYALSFEGERLTSTLSLAWTQVENLAGISETDAGIPLLTQSDETSRVTAVDLALGYQLTDDLLVNLVAEQMSYNNNFKASYAVAPIEERVSFSIDYDLPGFELLVSSTWVGSRDLSAYGYEGTDVLGSSIAKPLAAPSYWTLDFRLAKALGEQLTVYLGANNLTDYTQAGDESPPILFDAVGDPDAGYDVAYIYGPLRGREFYTGLTWRF